LLESQFSNEKHNTELHIPGTNYIGPGTKIATRVMTGVKPTSDVDHVALHHDIDYLRSNGAYMSMLADDFRAIRDSGWSPTGFLMKTGLTLRSVLATLTFNYVNFSGDRMLDQEAKLLADYLEHKHNTDMH
jgi:hypothetical protein